MIPVVKVFYRSEEKMRKHRIKTGELVIDAEVRSRISLLHFFFRFAKRLKHVSEMLFCRQMRARQKQQS